MSPDAKNKPPQEMWTAPPRFVGEQEGPAERELKEKLVELFGRLRLVRTGYLARLTYGDAESVSVALCVRSQLGQSRMFADHVSNIFGSMFGTHEHLDIIWLTPEQETELAKVCRPFFNIA